jgi:CHAD domain-containing protein
MFSPRSKLLRRHLNRFKTAINDAATGDVRAVHRTRVASRRLRELLPILQLDPHIVQKLGRRLRKVTKGLGVVRELDVLLMLIDELHVSRREHNQALARMAVAVSQERDAARERLSNRMPVDHMRRTARKLARIVDGLRESEQSTGRESAAEAWRWAVDARTAVRASRLSLAITEAGSVYLPERLHTVRIALKKLRYSVEMATAASGRKPGAELRMLKRAQDALGRLHDVQVLIEHVRQLQASLAPPSVAVWRALDELMIALENECRQLHARYMRQRARLQSTASSFGSHSERPHPLSSPPPTRRDGRARAGVAAERRSARGPVAV